MQEYDHLCISIDRWHWTTIIFDLVNESIVILKNCDRSFYYRYKYDKCTGIVRTWLESIVSESTDLLTIDHTRVKHEYSSIWVKTRKDSYDQFDLFLLNESVYDEENFLYEFDWLNVIDQ
jgi:tRNA splicing ligase